MSHQILYYDNGQKMFEGSPQDVAAGGTMTAWYRSGAKMAEAKAGRLIRWNENGTIAEDTALAAEHPLTEKPNGIS